MVKLHQANPSSKLRNQKPGAQIVQRVTLVDAIRGGAVLMMIFYHFGFDLNYLGWIHYDINYDQRWLIARSLILGTFLFTVGISLALAETQRKSSKQKLARLGKIAAAAALITVTSCMLFPDTAIYFGTLHAIAVMGLLLSVPLPARLAFFLGLVAIGLGNGYINPIFDHPALAWVGLMTYKPQTEDYVPMLPWFGVCLNGYAVGKMLFRHCLAEKLSNIQRLPRGLVWMGRHSLLIYLLHQPLILALLVPVTRLLRSA